MTAKPGADSGSDDDEDGVWGTVGVPTGSRTEDSLYSMKPQQLNTFTSLTINFACISAHK